MAPTTTHEYNLNLLSFNLTLTLLLTYALIQYQIKFSRQFSKFHDNRISDICIERKSPEFGCCFGARDRS